MKKSLLLLLPFVSIGLTVAAFEQFVPPAELHHTTGQTPEITTSPPRPSLVQLPRVDGMHVTLGQRTKALMSCQPLDESAGTVRVAYSFFTSPEDSRGGFSYLAYNAFVTERGIRTHPQIEETFQILNAERDVPTPTVLGMLGEIHPSTSMVHPNGRLRIDVDMVLTAVAAAVAAQSALAQREASVDSSTSDATACAIQTEIEELAAGRPAAKRSPAPQSMMSKTTSTTDLLVSSLQNLSAQQTPRLHSGPHTPASPGSSGRLSSASRSSGRPHSRSSVHSHSSVNVKVDLLRLSGCSSAASSGKDDGIFSFAAPGTRRMEGHLEVQRPCPFSPPTELLTQGLQALAATTRAAQVATASPSQRKPHAIGESPVVTSLTPEQQAKVSLGERVLTKTGWVESL